VAKILGFVCGPVILAGFLGLFLFYQGLMWQLSGLVFGLVDYPVWVVRGAVQELLGWEYFPASVAGLALGLSSIFWFRKMERELSRLLLPWR
jgi:hypothetical protein